MTGKPFLYKFGLVDAVVGEDDMDLPGRVKTNDMVEKFDEFSSPFPVDSMLYREFMQLSRLILTAEIPCIITPKVVT